jgi:N-acylneuraminate cytidylyltransferase
MKHLKQAFDKLISTGKEYVFSVTTFAFPIQRAIKVNLKGEVEPFFLEYIFSRSQDLEEAFHDAGQFYWGKCDAFLKDKQLFSCGSCPEILPRYLVQDIDTIEDWQQAELMYKMLQSSRNCV